MFIYQLFNVISSPTRGISYLRQKLSKIFYNLSLDNSNLNFYIKFRFIIIKIISFLLVILLFYQVYLVFYFLDFHFIKCLISPESDNNPGDNLPIIPPIIDSNSWLSKMFNWYHWLWSNNPRPVYNYFIPYYTREAINNMMQIQAINPEHFTGGLHLYPYSIYNYLPSPEHHLLQPSGFINVGELYSINMFKPILYQGFSCGVIYGLSIPIFKVLIFDYLWKTSIASASGLILQISRYIVG